VPCAVDSLHYGLRRNKARCYGVTASARMPLSITFPIKTIFLPIAVGYRLAIAGGVGLIEHANWGLYLLAACFVIVLVRTVLTAFEIMSGLHVGEWHRTGLPAGRAPR